MLDESFHVQLESLLGTHYPRVYKTSILIDSIYTRDSTSYFGVSQPMYTFVCPQFARKASRKAVGDTNRDCACIHHPRPALHRLKIPDRPVLITDDVSHPCPLLHLLHALRAPCFPMEEGFQDFCIIKADADRTGCPRSYPRWYLLLHR